MKILNYAPFFTFRGAFSYVFKARDTSTDKEVAIKVVRKRELDASEVGKKNGLLLSILN